MSDVKRPRPPGVHDHGESAPWEVPVELWALSLRDARRSRELSQDDLARAVDVTQQTISKIEAGRICPHDSLKVRLAQALDLPPVALFSWPTPLVWPHTVEVARSLLGGRHG